MSRALAAARAQILAVLGLALVATGLQVAAPAPATANPAGTHLVINEYSGGNGTGTGATDEFVELYNPTSATITFTGTIQYKSAAGSTYTAVSPVTNFVVPARGYWLVAGINYSGVAAPDSRYSFDGSASVTGGGHIALTGATTGVTTPAADPLRVDLLGFGTANTPEGTAAPNHPPSGGPLRRTNARDTDNNSVDFVQVSSRSPRSSTSPATTMTDPGAKSFAVDAAITPFSVTASGGRAPYTYAVSAGSLPDGLSLASTTGEISGTPTVARTAADVTVRATDANGDPSFRTFSVEVTGAAADPVTVTNPGNRSLTVGTAITPFSLATSGGTAPYTYAVTGGALPAGVVLDEETGEISGTPTAARAAADVTVTATDAEGDTGSTTFSVAVAQGTLSTAVPTIDDTEPAVDDVLTATAGTWGPAPVQLAYQWLADGVEIDDATGATLTVTDDLVGAVLAVRVTGTRAEYEPASVDSLDTAAVAARAVRFTTSPAVTGTLAGGQTLSADPGTTVPAAEEVAYQWRRDGAPIADATDATYVLVGDDLDADISVTVTASVDGYADAVETSAARGPVVAGSFTTGPTASISGTPVVGGTLTAATGTTTPTADSFTYAWTVGDDAAGTDSTLDLTPAMAGETVTVRVTAKRDGYDDAGDDSDPTTAVAKAAFTTGPTASITGTPVVGGTLTAATGTTNPAADSFAYVWTVDGQLAGTHGSTLVLTPAMVGKTVRVMVTAKRDGYIDALDGSDPTGPVARATFTTGPTASISGTPVVGGTLTAATGTTTPTADSFTYAWTVGDDAAGTDSTLDLTPAMAGETVTVRVTAKRDGYDDAGDDSDPTAAVARATFTTGPTASISGTPVVGGTLTAATGTTSPAADSFTYAWTVGGDEAGTGSTLDLTPAMAGKTVTVTITAKRDGYSDAADDSDPTDAVARATFTTGPTASISGTPMVGGTLTAATGTTSPAADSFTYAWTVDGDEAGTAGSLALTPAMLGKVVRLTVTAKRDGYTDAADDSDPTDAVARGTFTTGPTASISGTPVVGGTLTAVTGTTTPAADSFAYAWTVGDDEAGTTGSLSLTSAMAGKIVRLTVTAKRDGYTDATDDSDPTAAVAKATFTTGPTASISGTPVVGGTLTAVTTTPIPVADSFTYAWTVGGDEAGTGSTLDLTPAMAGRTATVTITAKRDGYTDASDVSDPTAQVARATFTTGPTASISGTPVVGGTLTAGTGTTSPTADSFTYAWSVGGTPVFGSTSTLELTSDMVGKTVTLTVTARRDGYTDASDPSDPTAAVARATFTTGPRAGILRDPLDAGLVVGTTLIADAGAPAPAPQAHLYAWTVGGVPAGTERTLLLTPQTVGKRVAVTVTIRRVGYTDASDESEPTDAVAPASFTTAPTASISGNARVGQVLTASAGSPVPTPDSLSYRWYADDAPISGANASTLTLTTGHAGRRIAVEVVALRAGFANAASRSSATDPVAADPEPVPSLDLRVSGPGGRAPSTSTTVRRGAPVVLRWSSDGGVLRASGKLRQLMKKRYGGAPIPSSGRISVRLVRLGTHRFQLSATNSSGTRTAGAVVSVVGASKRLHVRVPASARPGASIAVRVRGLGGGEDYSITVSGPGVRRQVLVGRATLSGVVARRVSVPAGATSGKRLRITVTGSTARRTGSAVIRLR